MPISGSIRPESKRSTVLAENTVLEDDKPRATSTDFVYRALRRQILDSDLFPGSQHLEQDLAEALQVSRTPVREALIRLQAENLVQVIPRHGARILPISPADMKDIYEVLMGLEPVATARVASLRPSDTALRPMTKACTRMGRASRSGDNEAWAQADDDFHLGIVALCGNARLIAIFMNCWDQVHRARRFTLRLRPHPDPARSIREHRDILDAIRAGDPKTAAARCLAHRERGWAEQLKVMTEYRIQQV